MSTPADAARLHGSITLPKHLDHDEVGPRVQSSTPPSVQLCRTKGWRLPPDTVVVARPSKWGNPYPVGETVVVDREKVTVRDAAHAVRLFTDYLTRHPELVELARRELRGKRLACWYQLGEACHREPLARAANADDPIVIVPRGPARRGNPSISGVER